MNTFIETGLKPEILRAIDEIGFVTPTAVQKQTLPHIMGSDTDLVALAQTGTGKTAAFGLPVLNRIDETSLQVQSLILCPTRELCLQITGDLEKFSKYQKISVVPVYGGASIDVQVRALRKGCQIVVGTPGRIIDLLRRKILKINSVKWLVLDEADEMLNMGFKDDLDTILAEIPRERQTLLFSATMPREIREISTKYMNKPLEISVGQRNAGAENVTHEYYAVHAKDRYLALKRVVDINPSIYGIVFCRTRQETKEVADHLMQDGYNADALHGDLSQAQRDFVMGRFRLKNLQILVATDVAARGLDVNDLTHVINFNLPDELEVYVHRSGRTGRAGKSGISVSIIHTREFNKVRDLERMTKKPFERKNVPGGREICEKQLYNLVDRVENTVVNDVEIEQYLPSIYKKLEWLSREDLIKRFVSYEFNRFLSYYENAPDLNVTLREKHEKSDRTERPGRDSSINFSRFYINLGTKNNIDKLGIIGLINKHVRGQRVEVGKIDLMRNFSFFEVDSRSEQDVLQGLQNMKFDGEAIVLQLSKPDVKSGPRNENDFPREREHKRKFSGNNRPPRKRN